MFFQMRGFIAVIGFFAAICAAANVNLSFKQGVNLTNVDKDFSFRYINNNEISLGVFKGYAWSSASVDVNTANSSVLESATTMIGVGLLPTIMNGPFSILLYGTGEAAFSTTLPRFAQFFVEAHALASVFQGNVVAFAPLSMQEVDKKGNAVGPQITFTPESASACKPKVISGAEGRLSGTTCTLSTVASALTITVTFVSSKDAGVVEYGNTPVSPRSFEMIIEVNNFYLSDSKNHVRMSVGIFSPSGTVENNAVVFHREGKEDLYAAMSNQAVVDGKNVAVTVKIESGSPRLDHTTQALLLAALNNTIVTPRVASVDFPAGVTNFVYDPAVGTGVNIYSATTAGSSTSSSTSNTGSTSGASTIALSLHAAVLSSVLLLFFF